MIRVRKLIKIVRLKKGETIGFLSNMISYVDKHRYDTRTSNNSRSERARKNRYIHFMF